MSKRIAALLCLAAAAFGASQSGPNAEALKKLSFLLGKWTSTETAKRPAAPDVEFTLHGVNQWAVGGTMLQIVESFDIPGAGPQHNHILVGYDGREKTYTMFWFTNSRSKPIVFSGNFDGANLVLTQAETATGGQVLRIVYRPKNEGEIDAELQVKVGDKFEPRTVAKYVKD